MAADELDAYGRRVPSRVTRSFAARRRMMTWAAELQMLHGAVCEAGLDSHADPLAIASVQDGLAQVLRGLLGLMPHVPCKCGAQGKTDTCELCRGKDWLSSDDLKRLAQARQPADLPEVLSDEES